MCMLNSTSPFHSRKKKWKEEEESHSRNDYITPLDYCEPFSLNWIIYFFLNNETSLVCILLSLEFFLSSSTNFVKEKWKFVAPDPPWIYYHLPVSSSSSSSTAGLEWAHSTYPCPPSRRSAAPFTSVIYSKSRSSSIFSACHTKPGAAEDGTARLATLSGALIVLDYSRLNEPFKCRQPSAISPLFFRFLFLIIINAFTRSERRFENCSDFHFELFFDSRLLMAPRRMVDSISSEFSHPGVRKNGKISDRRKFYFLKVMYIHLSSEFELIDGRVLNLFWYRRWLFFFSSFHSVSNFLLWVFKSQSPIWLSVESRPISMRSGPV